MTVKAKPKNKVYKIYAPNETIAINIFTSMCDKYKNSDNINNKEHWERLRNEIRNGNFVLTHIEDFCGVREVF